ncbi:hypothetical protein TELCIR_23791 [Teladorsagia circumcincta]|uniref:Ion transport domain-containing protein n=1 Tax=Teladorsagia circumcincta TaxID=45464 RepID=A0A2G9TA76_TELCI|nr:hypothetical protein TELCIR_23791 [Teladorsagia circumcincta]
MATVGYGDLVPVTVAGKMVGTGAIVCGVMVLALPITIMVNNFMQVVKLREEKIVKKYAQQHDCSWPSIVPFVLFDVGVTVDHITEPPTESEFSLKV